jgi:hypothetical protein
VGGEAGEFHKTRLDARDGFAQEETRRAALAALWQIYWNPLYEFARRRGHSPHDARHLKAVYRDL